MAEATPVQYTDKDDAVNPLNTDKYYEWWYFDGVFSNGYTCTVTFFWRNYFTNPHLPAVLIDIYNPEGKRTRGGKLYKPEECTASLEKCDVKMGDNYVRQVGREYHLLLKTQSIGAELVFKARVPGWKGTEECWIVDDATGRQGWVNAIPRAQIEGNLMIDGKTIPVEGQGYHDHNWGDRDMHESMGGWCWGRMYDDIYTFIYGWLLPVNETQKITPLLYITRDDVPVFGSVDIEYVEEKKELHPESGNVVPTDLTLKYSKDDIDIRVNIKVLRTIDCEKTVGVARFPLYYYRRLAEYTATLKFGNTTDRVKGQAINEYTYLSPVG